MFVFEPTNAKPPTPVTQFGNCQILPLAFMFCFAIFADPWGPRQSQDDGMAATVVWHIFANSDAGSSAGDSSGHFWVHCDRNNGYVAFEALRANRAVLKMRKGLLSYTSREISGQVVLRNMIGNHGMSCHKRCPIPTEPEALALFHFASTPHFTPAYCRPEPAEFSLSSRSSQITPGPAHLTLSHRDLRTRPDPASPVNRSTCRQIRSQVIKMFLSKGSEYSGTTCLENRNRFKSSRFRGSTRFLLYQGLTYRYATLQYTVRIQSDADFPCNVRDTEWPLIWGIYSAFGRVRRRIDWTNAH
ncbi:hypothetical protein B0H10DRAFT_1954204, partial [Mycena sp. CBHHK59/15]